VWNLAELKQSRLFLGHRDEVWRVSFLPDGETLVSGGKGGSVRLWKLTATNSNPSHGVLPERLRCVPALVANGQSFIAACRDGSVRQWDAHSLKEQERLSILGTGNLAVALSPDRRWLATADGSGNLRVWDWSSRLVVTNLAIPPAKHFTISFTARSGFLLANAQRWETATWVPLPAPPDFERHRVNCAGFAPNEREWATGHWDGKVKLWTFPGNELVVELPGHLERVNALTFAKDGRLLASVGVDCYVNLYDVSSRRRLARFRAHYNSACGACFSPDGQRLATFGNTRDCTKLWDLSTLRPLISFPWENHWHNWAAFSPDGSTLARLDNDGFLEFWHAPTFAEIEDIERAKVREAIP
jgi:WD40 repeat protein